MLLRPAAGHAEAGHHLVEDEHDVVLPGQLAEPFEEALDRRDDALDGLDDDPRDLAAVLPDEVRHRVEVVVRRDEHLIAHPGRDPGRVRYRAREVAGALRREALEARVAHPVVAALELEDLVAAPEGAGEAHRVGVRLGPRADEAHLLGARHRVGDRLRELDGVPVVGEEGRAELDLLAHRRGDPGMGMAGEHRPRADEVVDVLVPALVPHPASLPGAEDDLGARVSEPAGRHEPPRLLHQGQLVIASRQHFVRSSRW